MIFHKSGDTYIGVGTGVECQEGYTPPPPIKSSKRGCGYLRSILCFAACVVSYNRMCASYYREYLNLYHGCNTLANQIAA